MKQAYLKYFLAFLVGICPTFIIPAKANIPPSVTIAQAATYDQHMSNGYVATAKRKYKSALINFRQALSLRPNDRYALQAIDNVSRYVNALRSDRIYVPRNTGAPNNLGSGGSTGCGIGEKMPIALLPQGETLTTAKLPVLLVYMPPNINKRVEFTLLDSIDDEIYKTNITPSKSGGIVSLNLDTFPKVPSLENGKQYKWYLTWHCQENDPSRYIFVAGSIKKVDIDPLLTKELQTAQQSDRAFLYAVNGVWYDALATLYQARLSNPNNPVLSKSWVSLLKSVEIDKDLAENQSLAQQYQELPNEPLVKCCMPSSSKQGLDAK